MLWHILQLTLLLYSVNQFSSTPSMWLAGIKIKSTLSEPKSESIFFETKCNEQSRLWSCGWKYKFRHQDRKDSQRSASRVLVQLAGWHHLLTVFQKPFDDGSQRGSCQCRCSDLTTIATDMLYFPATKGTIASIVYKKVCRAYWAPMTHSETLLE